MVFFPWKKEGGRRKKRSKTTSVRWRKVGHDGDMRENSKINWNALRLGYQKDERNFSEEGGGRMLAELELWGGTTLSQSRCCYFRCLSPRMGEHIAGFPLVWNEVSLGFHSRANLEWKGCLWQPPSAHHLALGEAVCPPREGPCPTHLHTHPYSPTGGSISPGSCSCRMWLGRPANKSKGLAAGSKHLRSQALESYLVKV